MRQRLLKVVWLCLGGWSCFTGCSALAQQTETESDTKMILKELRELNIGVERMQKDLHELREARSEPRSAPLPAVQAVTNVSLDVEGRMFRGEKGARLAMIEFSDYECPFCHKFVSETLPRIEEEYIQAGKLKYYAFNFPLKSHPNAAIAARAVLCAKDSGRYWELRERLFSLKGAGNLSRESLLAMAKEAGVDEREFQECLDMGGYADEIQRDISDGEKAGVRGIPCFLVGFTDRGDSKVHILRLVSGARSYSQIKKVLDDLAASEIH
jgi:protein-disulfide isomerase